MAKVFITKLQQLYKRAKIALYRSPNYQIRFESIGFSVQEKKFNTSFKMAAMAAILDLQSEHF